MLRAIGIGLLAFVPMLSVLVGAQTVQELTLWTFAPEQEIKYFALTPSGDVFVTTEAQTFVVGSSEGEVIWSTDDLRDCGRPRGGYIQCRYLGERAELHFLTGTIYVRLVVDERFLILDLRSGAIVFDSADHPRGKVLEHQHARVVDQLLLFSERGERDYAVSVVRLGDS